MTTRRTVLQTMGLAALSSMLPRRASAASFGRFPKAITNSIPEARQVRNILEVYLYGGLSPWESFYYVPERGKGQKLFYHAFDDTENPEALAACGIDAPSSQSFARDANGVEVHLGPFARGLFERPDLRDRMRVVVQRHRLLPHEAAVPLGITGKLVGSPQLSSLAAHVQQASFDLLPRSEPYSVVLMNSGAVPSDNTDAFVATGIHPGSARPLRLNLDSAGRLLTLLSRPSVQPAVRSSYDDYVAANVEAFQRRIVHPGAGSALRANAVRELTASTRAIRSTREVAAMLSRELLVAPATELCGASGPNYTHSGLRLAAHLLKHPVTPARYVCLLDSGLLPASGGGGYDTHGPGEQLVQLRNLDNLLSGLGSVINAPGEADPSKLDLDETLIILNTEFGRTPAPQDEFGGRNHHTHGYVTVFIGGPTQGRTIHGAIGDDGAGIDAAAPAENRIAALLALGLYPFSPEGFSLSEVRGATSDQGAIELATQRMMGVVS